MRRTKKGVQGAYLIFGLVITFFIIHRCFITKTYDFSHALRMSASNCLYPVLRIQRSWVVFFENIKFKNKLQQVFLEQTHKLKDQNEQLRAQVIALEAQRNFADDTRELREFAKQYEQPGLLAQILFKQFGASEQFYLINLGQNAGITRDMAVVYKNCLVGKIIDVYPYYSKVLLLADRACKVAVTCAHTKTQGIYQGLSDLKVGAITHVGHLAKLEEQDLVLSSGEGLIFPAGFGVAQISSFTSRGIQFDVQAQLLLDFSSLTHCYVLQKSQPVLMGSQVDPDKLA